MMRDAVKPIRTDRSPSDDDPGPPRSKWEEYERRKVALRKLDLSEEEYEDAISQIAEQLGI